MKNNTLKSILQISRRVENIQYLQMTTPKKIKDINDKIIVKYENACDIINAIATYEDVSGKMGHLIEMQMYIRRVYMTE